MPSVQTDDFTVEVPIKITKDRIENLLISAFEGGSNYWYVILEKIGEIDASIYEHPFIEGGGLIIGDVEADDPYDDEAAFPPTTLNREALQRGMVIMAKKYPKHFADFIAENDDAWTGDAYLQCCLLGELVFG